MMKKAISLLAVLVIIVLSVCSCIPEADESKAQEKMEKAGYTVSIDKTSIPALIKAETDVNVKFLLVANKSADSSIESLYAFAFSSKDNAKTAMNYIKTWASKKLPSAEVVQKDEWVYFGTDAAVKAFTK